MNLDEKISFSYTQQAKLEFIMKFTLRGSGIKIRSVQEKWISFIEKATYGDADKMIEVRSYEKISCVDNLILLFSLIPKFFKIPHCITIHPENVIDNMLDMYHLECISRTSNEETTEKADKQIEQTKTLDYGFSEAFGLV